MFTTVPLALIGLDTVHCPTISDRLRTCVAFGYARIGLIAAMLLVSLLLWTLTEDRSPQE